MTELKGMDLLEVIIQKRGLKLVSIAEQLNISYQALRNKLDGKTEFVATEIRIITALLNLTSEEQSLIFF